LLPPVSLKKRKNLSEQDSQEPGSKKARGSTPKKSKRTSDEKKISEASKDTMVDDGLITDKSVSAKNVLEKVSEKSSKMTTRTSGSAAEVHIVSKKTSVPKHRRKLKLSA
jgi:hypothetical protein